MESGVDTGLAAVPASPAQAAAGPADGGQQGFNSSRYTLHSQGAEAVRFGSTSCVPTIIALPVKPVLLSSLLAASVGGQHVGTTRHCEAAV